MSKIGVLFLLLIPLVFSAQIQVTNNHPFLVNDSWISASELNVGDYLTSIDGKKIKIISIKDISNTQEVFNFETLFHNYITNNVIVHNSNTFLKFQQEALKNDFFNARRFIDKDDFFNALQGLYPDGTYDEILKTQPWLAYDKGKDNAGNSLQGSYHKWKLAWEYLTLQIKKNKGTPFEGKVTKEMIRTVGRIFEVKFRRDAMVYLSGIYNFRTDDFKMIYYEDEFTEYAKNTFLDVQYFGKLGESRNTLVYLGIYDKLMSTDIVEAERLEHDKDKLVVGSVSYLSWENIEDYLDDLCSSLNRKCVLTKEDAVREAAFFQRRLISIHPFRDFNGRISRLFMDYILVSKGLPPSQLEDPNKDLKLDYTEWNKEVEKGIHNSISNSYKEIPTQ